MLRHRGNATTRLPRSGHIGPHGHVKVSKSPSLLSENQHVLGQATLLFLQKCISSAAPFPKCLHFYTPDFSRLCSSSTAQGPQLIVDFAWRPVFYNPRILIALTVTWDCLMHLSKIRKEKKQTCETIQVIEKQPILL